MRWYLSWPRRLPGELALVLAYDTGSWFGNIRYRIEAVWYGFIMFVSSTWVLHIAYILTHKHTHIDFLVLHGALAGTTLTSAVIRYVGFSPALRQDVNPLTLLIVPIMNLTVCLLMCASLVVSVMWYIPWKRIDYHRCFAGAV
jgi:uncharacterized transporter YbjL